MSASPNRPQKARPPVTTDRDGAPDVRSHAHFKSICVVSTDTVSQATQTHNMSGRQPRRTHSMSVGVESDARRHAHRSVTHDTHVMLEGRHQYSPTMTLTPRAGPRCMAQLWQRKHQTRRIPGCEVMGVELNVTNGKNRPRKVVHDDLACWDTWGPSGSLWLRSHVCRHLNTRWTIQLYSVIQLLEKTHLYAKMRKYGRDRNRISRERKGRR